MRRWMMTVSLLVAGCADGPAASSGSSVGDSAQSDGAVADGTAGDGSSADGKPALTWWRPALDSTWQWQLLGDVDTAIDANVYDIDLFDAPDAVIAELHDQGRKVLCYFSAGSSEDWRPDFGDLPVEALGEPLDGWEGERWLDVRLEGVRAVMSARLDLAAARGCDGVEADNVDGWDNPTGFDLSGADQLAYNRWLAEQAHARGLAIALKNDGDQVTDLVDAFDLAVVEQCVELEECEQYEPFVAAEKPVFVAEYRADGAEATRDRASVCAAVSEGFHVLVLPLDLDGSFRVSCD